MNADDLQKVAATLADAERQRLPVDPPTDRWPDMTLEEAYAVQALNVAARVGAGDPVRGHKVGCTSQVMQEFFGVDHPDFGHLFASMFAFEAQPLEMGLYIDPMVEVETAFILGRRLEGPGVGVADMLRAIEYVVPALEIIDSRIQGWRIRLADTVADNGSSASVVIGGHPFLPTAVDLRDLSAELWLNGVPVESGKTSTVMGNPLTAAVWLVNTLGCMGCAVEEGYVILPGTCLRATRVSRGAAVTGRLSVLGDVSVRFE